MENNKTPSIRFKGFTDPWEQRKLGELGEISTGSTPSTANSAYYSDDGMPWVTPTDINALTISDTPRKLSEEGAKVGRVVPANTILCTCIASIGKNTLLTVKGSFNQQINSLTPYDENDAYFLLTESEIWSNTMKRMAASGTMQIVNKAEFSELKTKVPSLAEQQQIGTYFKNLDNLITLHQRKYDKLLNIKKSMLEKMFPKNGSNIPEIRFKGFTDPWEQRKLSELATMHARIGWQNLRTSEFLDVGDYMLITGTDFEDGKVNYSTCHYVEKERYDQDKNIQIKNGNILITKDGTIGKVAYVEGLCLPATLNAGVFNVEIKDENETDSKYLFQFLKAPFLMDYVSKKATGGTIKHLNQNILVDFPIATPSKAEQVRIGEYFSNLDNLITLHQRELEKLQNIKKSMLEKMFV